MHEFDVVIIGSGPTAIAALHSLDDSCKVGIVTGEVAAPVARLRLHPKILAVAAERGEVAGGADSLTRLAVKRKPLFSAAAIGGLANYWGQQFIGFMKGDPWPTNIFSDYDAYQVACGSIAGLFHIAGGQPLDIGLPSRSSFHAQTPTLLIGAGDIAPSGLTAMRQVFEGLKKKLNPTIFAKRAHTISAISNGCHVMLDDGLTICARQVFLAAGVPGNTSLLFRSYPDIARARFSDHSPWMIYTLGLGRVLAARVPNTTRHFNAVNIERTENSRSLVYASIYDVRKADLNLLLGSTLGWVSKRLRRWPIPPGASLIKPVQVWTEEGIDTIEIDAATRTAVSLTGPMQYAKSDPGLSAMVEVLKSLGGKILKISGTSPGYGFHYHSLQLQPASGTFSPIANFLSERTGPAVICVDASILQKVGCRPHTLTAMAAASSLVSHDRMRLGNVFQGRL